MKSHKKRRAAATANSDHPAKENLYRQDSTITAQQKQERFFRQNGRVLRWINSQRNLYTDLEDICSDLRKDGISTKEVYKSIGYLSGRGYVRISKNENAVRISALGIRLLAGAVQDSNIAV